MLDGLEMELAKENIFFLLCCCWSGWWWLGLNSVGDVGLSSGFVGHPSCCRDFVALFCGWWVTIRCLFLEEMSSKNSRLGLLQWTFMGTTQWLQDTKRTHLPLNKNDHHQSLGDSPLHQRDSGHPLQSTTSPEIWAVVKLPHQTSNAGSIYTIHIVGVLYNSVRLPKELYPNQFLCFQTTYHFILLSNPHACPQPYSLKKIRNTD